MDFMLELKGTTKWSGSLAADDRISLSARKGTVHTVIGENRAGKNTLMNVISDLYRSDEGELFIREKKVDFKNPDDASRAGIGMVHQEFTLFLELTVLDNIMMGYEKKKWGIFLSREVARYHMEDICREYHSNIPLDELIQNPPVSMLQQVEIVKILYWGVDIIIFDEPTSMPTPQGIQDLFEVIRFLMENGKTVSFITHELKEVMEISDRITVLKNGHYVGTIKPDETDECGLATMMVGRKVILTVQKEEKKQGDMLPQIRHLSVPDYEGREKLKDIFFEVRRGETLGIAGMASFGQQELVEGLSGLKNNSRGEILLDGKDITGLNYREHRMCHIGYVPQNRINEGINREATLRENAIMGYRTVKGFGNRYPLRRKQAISFIEHIIHDFSARISLPNLRIQTFPGGDIQKPTVGKEFLQDNCLLITEDPTRDIDIGTIESIWRKIESLTDAGAVVLLVSHELDEMMEVSDRILIMYDGQLHDGGIHGEETEVEIEPSVMGDGYA